MAISFHSTRPSQMCWPCFCIHAAAFLLSCLGSDPNFLTSATPMIGGNVTDQLALLEFKAKITSDPLGILQSWNSTVHFCQWHGVTCGRRHQRVTVLNLESLELSGSISSHVGNLSFLRSLSLENNSFNKEIPSEIGRLHRLRGLRLHNNSLSGKIPSNISRCSNLIILAVSRNQLKGEIPVEFGSFLKLKFVSLGYNNLTGSIPPSLGNLSFLESFSVVYNNLVGSIPDALGQLKNLTFLSLAANRLAGIVPSSIFNLSNVEVFDVGTNKIYGTLPSDLGITLPNLQVFAISDNQFTGSIPVSISNASNLVQLEIVLNKFTGKMPSLENLQKLEFLEISGNLLGSGGANDLAFLCSLINATSLQSVGLNWNNFGGTLPECISRFPTSVSTFYLNNNKISGSISGIENLLNLESLHMERNQLSGHIPPGIGRLGKLKELYFFENNLSGNIPSALGSLKMLIKLRLNDNNLQGNIPSSLGNCENLAGLDLSNNDLSGFIPPQIGNLSSLSIGLDLSHNHLTGTLPFEIGKLKNMGYLNVSQNALYGEIPSSLGGCVSLEVLDMQGNFFQGMIPSSLGSLKAMQELNLSQNNLSGKIPEFLEQFVLLKHLNLSYNDFEGMVPTEGAFKNVNITSVEGNMKLCGGVPEFQLPKCKFNKSKKRLTLSQRIIIATVSGLLGIIFGVFFLLFWLRNRNRRKKSTSNGLDSMLLNLSYQTLLKATDGFSSANLIGMGSFGSVYKGVLDQGSTIIAVKVLNLQCPGAFKSFIAECEALKNIRHRNLVKVLTACSGVDYHGNDFKALVYEFMANGSLEEWLHPVLGICEAGEAQKSLNLLQRLNIAIDVAWALDYLHNHCETPIVHCDLKPSNVLLDNEMTGHVGDFGLARFLPAATHNSAANEASSFGIRGSIGYTAPEYGMGNEVSTYGDVYSYGILLLEMFTAKRPNDGLFMEGLNLHKFARAALPERVTEIADPILLLEGEWNTSANNSSKQRNMRNQEIHKCLVSLIEIGVACSAELPGERMNISSVAIHLCGIRDKLLKTGKSLPR